MRSQGIFDQQVFGERGTFGERLPSARNMGNGAMTPHAIVPTTSATQARNITPPSPPPGAVFSPGRAVRVRGQMHALLPVTQMMHAVLPVASTGIPAGTAYTPGGVTPVTAQAAALLPVGSQMHAVLPIGRQRQVFQGYGSPDGLGGFRGFGGLIGYGG